MSEPPGSPEENLRRVREKVMQLAREIETMSGEDVPPNIYFPEFLNRVVSAIGAKGGAVWMIADGGRLSLAAEANLDETGLKEIPGAMQVNEKLLIDVLQTGEAKTLVHGQGVDLPTEHVMVLSAIHKEKDCVGVVQLFQRSDVPEKARSGYMQFLEQMCGYASRYVEGKRRNAAMSDDLKSQFWTDFEQFTLRIQRSLDEQEVSDASASDGRPLLGCDRLSVITKKGSSVKVRAVSGQSTVNARANLIVSMRKLAKRVISSGETLMYAGKIDGLAPQVEKPLANFVQESGSRMIMMVPMFQSDQLVREQGEDAARKRKTKKPKAIGCIVVEQVAESEPVPQLEQRAELLADHIGAAMWNSRQHGRIFGRSLFKMFGSMLEWFQGKKLAITAAVLCGVGLLVAGLATYRLPYPVDAKGKLMPVEQHAVFAQHDGKIVDILVTPNASGAIRVTKGQPLLQLENGDLDGQIEKAQGQYDEQITLETQTRTTLSTLVGDDIAEQEHRLEIELLRIRGEKQIAEQEIKRLQKRKKEKLTILAPATGIIPDFKRLDILAGRPVHEGDHLFDVMNDKGDWHMELLVVEKRMGHLNRALLAKDPSGSDYTLNGDFTMASLPQSKFGCKLTKMASRSTVDSELGTAFELVAVADEGTEIPTGQIGTEVTARFDCEDCSLAFYLFGDVVEFVQRSLWWF